MRRCSSSSPNDSQICYACFRPRPGSRTASPGQPLPPSSPELRDCTLYCIQFVADGYYLHKGRFISTSLWRLWEREIKRTLGGPLFSREWENVKAEFAHDPQFSHYISCLTQRKS